MDAGRSQRVAELFGAALGLDEAGRIALLDRECGDDVELRAEVLDLLDQADRADRDDFLGAKTWSGEDVGTSPEPVGVPGRYEDLRDPKEGGMAVVYRATDVEIGREVAYKVMNAVKDADRERSRLLFVREAEITARLQHPGIVPVFGWVVDGSGRPAYAMGYVEGADFWASDLRDQPIRDRLVAFRDACRIVGFAHGRGYAHSDISPKNLMIAGDRAVYVVDWGLARRVDEPAGAVGLPEPCTRGFSPPSVERGGPRTCATDVYSLGAVLAALTFGITERQPDLQGPGVKATPKAIRDIIDAAMVDGENRTYPTAGDLADDVQNYLDGSKVSAHREPIQERTWRVIRRHPARAAVAIASVLLLLVASTSAALVVAAREHAASNEEKALRLAEEKEAARKDASQAEAINAMFSCEKIVQRNPIPDTMPSTLIDPLMRLLTLMGHRPDFPAEMIEFNRARDEMGREAGPGAAELRRDDPARLLEIIATLERIDGRFPEIGRVRSDLAASYCALGTLELHRATAELGAFKLTFALKGALDGKPLRRPEVEAALAKFDKALEHFAVAPTPEDPSDRKTHRKIGGTACLGRAVALVQLGRFTEASMACERSIELTEGPQRLATMKFRSILLKAAEVEQSHMPWSDPPHVDHPKAIEMADYLAGQPNVSQAATFNAACAFSLASLDERAGEAERGRRAARAVALLDQIERKNYFRGAKQARELRDDKALDPVRSRADFRDLAERVAKGG